MMQWPKKGKALADLKNKGEKAIVMIGRPYNCHDSGANLDLPEKISEYLKDNNYSRAILASNFLQEVNSGKVDFNKLDEETRDNLEQFTKRLSGLLK